MQDYWLGFLSCAVLVAVYRTLSYLARERTIRENIDELMARVSKIEKSLKDGAK